MPLCECHFNENGMNVYVPVKDRTEVCDIGNDSLPIGREYLVKTQFQTAEECSIKSHTSPY